jgi:hypothetical protein
MSFIRGGRRLGRCFKPQNVKCKIQNVKVVVCCPDTLCFPAAGSPDGRFECSETRCLILFDGFEVVAVIAEFIQLIELETLVIGAAHRKYLLSNK